MKPMGEWNENKETKLDKTMNVLASYWGGVLIVVIWCVASTMAYNDELKKDSAREYKVHSVDYGRESVKIGTVKESE